MALRSRVKAGGWAFGELLTSAQQTQVDINAAESIQGTSGTYGIESVSVTRMSMFSPFSSDGDAVVTLNDVTITNASAATVNWFLDVPHGATLTAWSAYIIPPTGHGGEPATMPTARLWRVSALGANAAVAALVTDTYGSAPAYETQGPLGNRAGSTQTGLSEVIDAASYRYYVQITTEGGANAENNFSVKSVSWTATVGALDIG